MKTCTVHATQCRRGVMHEDVPSVRTVTASVMGRAWSLSFAMLPPGEVVEGWKDAEPGNTGLQAASLLEVGRGLCCGAVYREK